MTSCSPTPGLRSLQKPEEYECQVEQLEAEARDRLDQLSMFNSSWMINASLLGQSPVEGGPYCASGRVILMAWWFFMMILSAMYTANLAAFLTGKIKTPELRYFDSILYFSINFWAHSY